MSDEQARRLGKWLQQRRDEMGITLEQAETDTRIRGRFLEALEAEDFDALPDPVVTRGFLRNYAGYLDLDAQQAANLYSELAGLPDPKTVAVAGSSPFATGPFQPVPLHEQRSRRSWAWWLVGILPIVVAGSAFALWWARPAWLAGWLPWMDAATPALQATANLEVTGLEAATTTSVATPTSRVTFTPSVGATEATSTPQATLTYTPTPKPSLTPTGTPTQPVYTGIFLELLFTDTSWIQVSVDGVREFQGELEAGTYRSWYADQRIELRIGNAGAVDITINGQRLGPLGEPGEVVDRVFEKLDDGVSQATVTPETPVTPTEAPGTVEPTSVTPSITVTPTATVLPTDTPTPGP